MAEKNAADMKKRFVSYSTSCCVPPLTTVFHEVRVPLNTALLSVQNLKEDGALSSGNTEQAELTTGLTSSLSMMEKVNIFVLLVRPGNTVQNESLNARYSMTSFHSTVWNRENSSLFAFLSTFIQSSNLLQNQPRRALRPRA